MLGGDHVLKKVIFLCLEDRPEMRPGMESIRGQLEEVMVKTAGGGVPRVIELMRENEEKENVLVELRKSSEEMEEQMKHFEERESIIAKQMREKEECLNELKKEKEDKELELVKMKEDSQEKEKCVMQLNEKLIKKGKRIVSLVEYVRVRKQDCVCMIAYKLYDDNYLSLFELPFYQNCSAEAVGCPPDYETQKEVIQPILPQKLKKGDEW